jgi:hypothetical protein
MIIIHYVSAVIAHKSIVIKNVPDENNVWKQIDLGRHTTTLLLEDIIISSIQEKSA